MLRTADREGIVAEYTVVRVSDVKDMAADVGMDPDHFEIRFLREAFGLRALGIVREDRALIERAAATFAELGLAWHAETTRALV